MSRSFLFIAALSLVIAAPEAFGRAKLKEVYSATESESPVVMKRTPNNVKTVQLPRTESLPIQEAAVAAAAELEKYSFDAVPAEHVDSIAGRLSLVEKLLRDYGRAYDYRVHTTAELKGILANLETVSRANGTRVAE